MMKGILKVELEFEDINGKSKDNIIFALTKIFKDLSKLQQSSEIHLEIIINKVSVKANENVPLTPEKILQTLPIHLN